MKELAHLNALRCVEAAARHRSYTKAAEELHVSQAAISQQVRRMETVLDTKLFIRQGRRMEPTRKGKQLAEHLARGFQTIVDGLHQIQSEPVAGTLNVTTTQSFAVMLLMPNLWQFRRRHPDINIRVTVSTELEDLRHGEMDIGIRFGFFEQRDLHQVLLFDDGLVPLCSPQLLNDIDLADPCNLKECRLVDANYKPGRDWLTWMKMMGLEFRADELKWLQVSNLDLALSAVMSGHGIFLGSLTLARQFIRAGTLVNPFHQCIEEGIRYSLLYDESSPRLRRIQVFEEWLLDLMRESRAPERTGRARAEA